MIWIVLSFCAAQQSAPPWTCLVCEDVVQTYHDHYACAGNFLYTEGSLQPDLDGCQQPSFRCSMLSGSLQTMCEEMQHEFTYQPPRAALLWSSMMSTGKVYQACVALGKCDADPPSNVTPCHRAFQNPDCEGKIKCYRFPSSCTQECYLCNELVRDWPIYQEICKPPGATLPSNVITRRLLTTSNRLDPTTPDTKGKKTGTGTGTGTGITAGAQPRKRMMETSYTLVETCDKLWSAVQLSKKARYFMSWKEYVGVMNSVTDRLTGRMWDANVVCKCLGHCPLKPLEQLTLEDACQFDAQDEIAMRMIFAD